MSYGKVYDAYWGGDKIAPLSDQACLLGLFLITGPHRNAIGCFKLGLGALTDDDRFKKWGIEGVSKALREMMETGFIIRDESTGWTFITATFRHDPPRGEKAIKHAVKLAALVPANSIVYPALKAALEPEIARELKEAEEKKRPVTIPDGWPMRAPSYPPSHTPSEGASNTLTIPKPSPIPIPAPIPAPEPIPAPAPAPTRARAGDQPPEPTRSAPAAPPPAAVAPALSPLEAGRLEGELRMKIGGRVLELCGIDPTKWFGNFAIVSQWLNSGFDPELDIYPTVERRARRPGFTPPRSFGLFTEDIAEAHRIRTTPVRARAAGALTAAGPSAAASPPRIARRAEDDLAEDRARLDQLLGATPETVASAAEPKTDGAA